MSRYEPAGVYSETVLYKGVTTSNGAGGGTTLIDSALVGVNDFVTDTIIVIQSGNCIREVQDVSSFTNVTGTITVGTAFSAQIVSGVTFALIARMSGDVEIAALQADVGDASASTLGSLYSILGNPSTSLATTILDGIDARANNPTLNALLGVPDAAGKSINGNIGDFQARTNLTTLLASLGIPDTAGKDLYTCLITDRLDHGTYGLSALETLVDSLEQRIVTIPTMMEFPSEIDDIITLTTATSNVALPDIVVADIPTNTTVIRAVGDLYVHSFNNTSVVLNAINGAGMIQIQKSVAGTYTNLTTIPDNIWRTPASTEVGGMCVRGTNDASAEVTANGTYNLKFNGNIFVDANNLELSDVQVVLKIYFIPT